MEAASSSISSSAYIGSAQSGQHAFVNTKDRVYCLVCHNLWRSTDSVISSYQYCRNCDLSVHSECRSIANKHVPCCSDPKWAATELSQNDKASILKIKGKGERESEGERDWGESEVVLLYMEFK